MKNKKRKLLFVLLVLCSIGIGILHALTPGYMVFFHDSYRRLSYFPITFGAVFFGLQGGLILSVLSCLAYIPHLLVFWASGPEYYYSELSEILFYLAAGIVIGLISSRENRLREKYRNLSEKLGASYEHLHHQAKKLMEAENELNRTQKMSMLGHISASLAHELKNPLASIRGAAEILSDEIREDNPKHEFIEIMRSEVSRLNRSVEDVLEYCRTQQKHSKGKTELLSEIIRHVVSLLESKIKEKNIELELRLDSGHDFAIDEDAMIQVLLNILLNAVDAVEPEKGKIIIEIGQERDGGRLISISDNGPGIAEDMKEIIFESFITFKEGGTGLGLSISRKIVETMGGKISLGKSIYGGANFLLFIPQKIQLGRS